jgi:hypothetical protein
MPLHSGSFPTRPAVPRTRLLVLACGVKIHFPWVLACERSAAAIATVRKAVAGLPIDIVPFPEPFEDPTALLAALDTELPKGIAGIVFFHAAYTAGEIGSHFGRWLIDHPVPVLSWSHPDPRIRTQHRQQLLLPELHPRHVVATRCAVRLDARPHR